MYAERERERERCVCIYIYRERERETHRYKHFTSRLEGVDAPSSAALPRRGRPPTRGPDLQRRVGGALN